MFRAADLASESWPFFCWPRKAGRAIAARMPMIRITTRSSMSVKPFSSLLIRWESFRSMVTPPWSLWSGQIPRQPPRWWQHGRLLQGEPPHGSPGALRPRLATGLPLHRGPDSYWGHLSTPGMGFLSSSFVEGRLWAAPTILRLPFRRAILLFALVLGLAALAAAVSPSRVAKGPALTPPAGGAQTEAATRELVFGAGGRRVRGAREGEHVVVSVPSEAGGLATIPRLGRTASAGPAAPAQFDLLAPPPGRYDVMLEVSGANEPKRVGTLVTRP